MMNAHLKAISPVPDYRDVRRILATKDFEPGLAVERQVAAHVRTLIQQGAIAANTRLPPIRTLAELWNTNYFTVQTALRRLVGEGLLVQSPKLGTFVAPLKRSFRRACLYHDQDLRFEAQGEFFSRLNIWLYRLLAERGIQTTSFFDHRKGDKINTIPPEIRQMIKDREIDAFIATSHNAGVNWIADLDIPHASPFLDSKHGGIVFDFNHLVRQAIDEAAKAGKRCMGLIYRHSRRKKPSKTQSGDLRSEIEKAARERGIKVIIPEGLEEAERLPVLEQAGFHLCEELLRSSTELDALFVYPDTYTHGVVSALLKNRISVPDQILLISHRNADITFFTPFPVKWLIVQIEDFAQGLLKQIDLQIAGKKAPPIIVTSRLEVENGRKPTKRPSRKAAAKS
jgi:DNA-binding transcriptional regulator YhcF (GntR family)